MTYSEIILKVLADSDDWIPSYLLRGVDTEHGWIGTSGDRRARELAEAGLIRVRVNGKYAEYHSKEETMKQLTLDEKKALINHPRVHAQEAVGEWTTGGFPKGRKFWAKFFGVKGDVVLWYDHEVRCCAWVEMPFPCEFDPDDASIAIFKTERMSFNWSALRDLLEGVSETRVPLCRCGHTHSNSYGFCDSPACECEALQMVF